MKRRGNSRSAAVVERAEKNWHAVGGLDAERHLRVGSHITVAAEVARGVVAQSPVGGGDRKDVWRVNLTQRYYPAGVKARRLAKKL